MEFIQKLFLKAGAFIESTNAWEETIPLLENEPPEYRSVGFEGASFEIAMKDLKNGGDLLQWEKFKMAFERHGFHIDIGLGWAFAKTGVSSYSYLQSINDRASSMILDGIGYYYGLFKGRSTLKNKMIPEAIDEKNLHGFDQGLGRRIWYIAKGNVQEAIGLVRSFPEYRHASLIRGIGIACGYVGGNEENTLKYLNEISGDHREQLRAGIILAAISRIVSDTITPDIEQVCKIICNVNVNQLRATMVTTTSNFLYLYNNQVVQ